MALITLNYRDSKPIYEQVKDGFRKLILSGVLSTGDKLLSEVTGSRRDELFAMFDETATELLHLGIGTDDLTARIQSLL